MLPLVALLTDPAGHGGDPDDAFGVVIPSLPGFAFSGMPAAEPVTTPVIADLWARLMSYVLGYPRFGAYGGDICSHVTGFLGARHRYRVLGSYTHHPNPHPVVDGTQPLSAAEQGYLAARQAEHSRGDGYAGIQSTRPVWPGCKSRCCQPPCSCRPAPATAPTCNSAPRSRHRCGWTRSTPSIAWSSSSNEPN
jgi:hypothetical protein